MRRHLIFITIFSLLAATLTCCDGRPDYVLDQDGMTDLLYDIQLAEAMTKFNYLPGGQKQMQYLFKSVFDRHNLTPEQFDSCIAWYTRHPDLYDEINKTIIARYGEEIERIKEYKAPAKMPLILTLRDSTPPYFSASDSCSHPYVERLGSWTVRWE